MFTLDFSLLSVTFEGKSISCVLLLTVVASILMKALLLAGPLSI
jgi:hypothetical protein